MKATRSRPKKPKAGRPSLGDRGRTKVLAIKLSQLEYDAIATAVAKENAELKRDGALETEGPTTISGWIRDHALESLGLATYEVD